MSRWGYAGIEFTTKDNPKLPCIIRIMPSGTVYGEDQNRTMRTLDSILMRTGMAISGPGGEFIMAPNTKTILVGEDEIMARKKIEVKAE